MPPIILEPWLVITLDVVLWFVIHMGMSWLAEQIPSRHFEHDVFPYKTYAFEKNGVFYEKVVLIKAWKKYLPDGAKLFKSGFSKKALRATDPEYLRRFITESRRAEAAHLMQIAPVGLFFLFNEVWVGWIMVLYAILANLPCIITQRYNRPRFMRLLKAAESRNKT